MACRSRVFIDFWNFTLNWRDRVKKGTGPDCDWPRLPAAILRASEALLAAAGVPDTMILEETLVYASVEARQDPNLKNWLDNFLDRQPSFRVITRERQSRPVRIHCRACGAETEHCPACGATLRRAVEKGIDAAIVTDLLSLAWQGAFDAAVLVSSDADFVPAVTRIQEKGLKVVNAGWARHGHELKKACWASFDIDTIASEVYR